MPEQTTLFQEHQQRRGDGHIFVQEPAEGPPPHEPKAEQEHAEKTDGSEASLDALIKTLKTLSDRCFWYLHLMRCVMGGKLRSDGDGLLFDLTDKEAAAWLGWDRSTINGRRNQLSGGSMALPGTKAHPLIVKSTRPEVDEKHRRPCLVTGNSATAWQASADLFYDVEHSTRCSSCGMPIRFVTTPEGKKMPVDVVKHIPTDGKALITDHGRVVRDGSQGGYVPHWTTCPHADKHRS